MDYRVEAVASFIEKYSHKTLRLDELSRMVNLSTWRMCHLFKKEMGTSITHFIHGVRLRQARYMLETTFLTVKEIRTKVGFFDESQFIKAFRRAYCAPPSRYRLLYLRARTNGESGGRDSQQNKQVNSKIDQY